MLTMQLLVFVLGLCIGSFLNVCIYRIPEKKSIAFPPSHCPNCKHNLSALDLLPLLGYLFNRGKCRYCKTKISAQYPLVELMTGIFFLLVFNKYLISIEFLKYIVLISLLIAVSFIDIEKQEIPDGLIICGLIAAMLFNLYHIRTEMINGILGFLIGGGSFLLIAILTKGAMGGGDIKLVAVLGLFFGWRLILMVILLSFVLGAILSLILIAAGKRTRKDYIPFGPFIAAASILVIFYGTQLLAFYMSFII